MKRIAIVVAAVLVLAVVALPLMGLAVWAVGNVGAVWPLSASAATVDEAPAPASAAAQPPAVQITRDATLLALEEALQAIYEEVSPSVVQIEVVQRTAGTFSPFGFQLPDQFQRGSGSGFVWDTEGHIVTNNHVVEGASRIVVRLADGAVEEATLVGADRDSDLAVLQVDVPADGLRPVTLADSTAVRVGQLAVAIGNPFGLESTMTVGFVSALGRSLPVSAEETSETTYSIPDVIQTDASINPGNSGGVLVNANGQVIGVTTAIASAVRSSAGVGFAVPSAIVARVVPALIETGEYIDPWIGITGTTLTPDLAEAMDLPRDQRGGLVIDVVPASPADEAGLVGSDRTVSIDGQEVRVGGDVIVAIDDEPVLLFDDLIVYLSRNTEVGDEITLTVLRDGRQVAVDLTLQPRPEEQGQRASTATSRTGQAWLGVNGVTLTPALGQAIGVGRNQPGVLVLNVTGGSPADEAGIRGGFRPTILNGQRILLGGDIIVAWDGEPVESTGHLQALLRSASPGDEVTLTLVRAGEELAVEVTLATEP